MLFSLRRTPSAHPDTPQALLQWCHDRTRDCLGIAERLVTLDPNSVQAGEVAEACAILGRHFTEVLPLHERDEIETVVPALSGHRSLDEHLAMISNEHAVLQAIIAEITPIWARLDDDRAAFEVLRPGLRIATRRLIAIYELHLAREEEHVFPKLADLSAEVQATLLAEMRGRRGFTSPA